MPTFIRDTYPIFVLLGLAAAITTPIVRALYQCAQREWERDTRKECPTGMAHIVGGAVCGLFGCALICVGLLRFADLDSVAIRNGQVVAVFSHGAALWRWDSRVKGASLESYAAQPFAATINTKPITANPEVRELVCEVRLEVDGTPESYVRFRQSEWVKDPAARLEYYLYEFEEKYHGQLARFYNPKSEEQQKQFQDMTFEFLRPHLDGSGIWFRSAFFRRPLHD